MRPSPVFHLTIFLVMCCCAACQEPNQVITEPTPPGEPFQVSALNYATNYYFVDTSYLAAYEPYYLNEPPLENPAQQLREIEVWIENVLPIADPNVRQAIAFAQIPVFNGKYRDSLRTGPQVPGSIEAGLFLRLDPSQYEIVGDGYVGIIRLVPPLDDAGAVAVAYRRGDGTQYGEFVGNSRTDTAAWLPLVLKLVKPRNLLSNGSKNSYGWKLLAKSFYSIGESNVTAAGFQLDVYRQTSGLAEINSIMEQPLLRILGLDRYSQDGSPSSAGDRKFDFRPGRTINPAAGDIILPFLRPFDDGIRRYFDSIRQPIPANSDLLLPGLYDGNPPVFGKPIVLSYLIKGSALH